ncbi:hypothetical protein ACEQ8H_000533 [Pleosporales sp. CAS-2024a]
MASISQLPAEMLELICSYLEQPALYAVCQVRRSLHVLALPFLYKHVDLRIRPGDKMRRIDWFCLHVIQDRRLAARVESIRFGPSPEEGKVGQRWLPYDRHFDDAAMFDLAIHLLYDESLVVNGDHLRDALYVREYAAFAALIIIVLPGLRALHLADFKTPSLDHIYLALRNLKTTHEWNRRHASEHLTQSLSRVKSVTFNFDEQSGRAYSKDTSRFDLGPILNLPQIETIEFSVPDTSHMQRNLFAVSRFNLPKTGNMRNVTRLVVRHSNASLRILQPLLEGIIQLQSFTYDFFHDCNERDDVPSRWLDLAAWSDSLPQSLRILVFSVENCDTSAFAFKQPRIDKKLFGYLDLTRHHDLHTLELPYPFLTGDVNFSITTEIDPLLPPNLRHLSLRTDMSQAQYQFPFDVSRLPNSLTFQESEDDARHLLNARMDVSYMFHAAMSLLEFSTSLKTISVWQPADPSLTWFNGQFTDFAHTCRNKSIKGLVIYPMILRWKSEDHWDLVKEVVAHDPCHPTLEGHEKLYRGERSGIPLGLAAQYHINALKSHQLRLR